MSNIAGAFPHDIWHVITGFDISEIGEIGLQAFYLAQFGLPFSGLVVASGLVGSILYQPEETGLLLDAVARGWHMGKQAKPLIAQRWEEMWSKPLFLFATRIKCNYHSVIVYNVLF